MEQIKKDYATGSAVTKNIKTSDWLISVALVV